jgi:purine-binding chemotaxis protein CheW
MRIEVSAHYLVFMVGGARHALSLAGVETVELAAEVTPFPDAPHIFIGAIDCRGQVLPVLSMRRRLRLPERSVRATDRFIIVRSAKRRLALLVDDVVGVQSADGTVITSAKEISDGLGCVAGATRTHDGIMLIHDIELFLSEEEEKALAKL